MTVASLPVLSAPPQPHPTPALQAKGPLDVRGKLAILADAAKYDASCASSGAKGARDRKKNSDPGLGSTESMGICHSYTPDGRCVSLLKILLTNYCIYDCQYCVNRITSDVRRARFKIDEVVSLTLEFYKRNYIEGLFLSSGIIGSPDDTMIELTEVARRLREDHQFRGYIHLKTIPECSEELLEQAGRYADRLSINVELPTETDLKKLAPEKRTPQIEAAMAEVKARRDANRADRRRGFKASPFAPAGQSTQMIVGATDTPDRDILRTSTRLYQRHDLRRVYYSAYSPIPHADARLPGQSPPLVREHRLYQADWLLRFYGFEAEEITPDDAPDLDLELDPKTAWALRHRGLFPVGVNTAPREMLLRVPGLGVRSVDRILKIRRFRALRLADLKRLRVPLKKARPFLLTADPGGGKHLDSESLRERFAPKPTQRLLFDAAGSALTGEV
ncbi:hypothetical protein LzC2_33770 [Planctomycetes bacterium LzC2]|uniref:Radical SAM core domain-containing protein n=1 Tax=Alienimonas chondri TaxID=2681879 RepID=A0ABX1VID7_9PLAN|nr:putative DNA modification/repair radical SAM protein [Alienimonas chondri]NNJ27275.1 hypothetical protein [Alienimonas chondri]